MALSEQFIEDETHPIDIVETLAEHHNWDFDRIADDQIAMAVVGQWRTYSITLAWSDFDETLRMVCVPLKWIRRLKKFRPCIMP